MLPLYLALNITVESHKIYQPFRASRLFHKRNNRHFGLLWVNCRLLFKQRCRDGHLLDNDLRHFRNYFCQNIALQLRRTQTENNSPVLQQFLNYRVQHKNLTVPLAAVLPNRRVFPLDPVSDNTCTTGHHRWVQQLYARVLKRVSSWHWKVRVSFFAIYIHSNEIYTVAALTVYWCTGVSSTCFGP